MSALLSGRRGDVPPRSRRPPVFSDVDADRLSDLGALMIDAAKDRSAHRDRAIASPFGTLHEATFTRRSRSALRFPRDPHPLASLAPDDIVVDRHRASRCVARRGRIARPSSRRRVTPRARGAEPAATDAPASRPLRPTSIPICRPIFWPRLSARRASAANQRRAASTRSRPRLHVPAVPRIRDLDAFEMHPPSRGPPIEVAAIDPADISRTHPRTSKASMRR